MPKHPEISNESIRFLLYREEPPEDTFPMYRSRLSKWVREDVKKKKLCHRTFGFPPDYPRTPPEEFLRKRTRIVRRPVVVGVEKPMAEAKSKVPRREDWIKIAEKRYVDHIGNNIRKAIKPRPPGPFANYDPVFCKRVNHRIYCTPEYSKSKNFGKVPQYIIERKKTLEEEEAERVKQLEKALPEPVLRLVPPEERQKLLDDLKSVWTDMQREFQLLPMLTDTPPKISHKTRMEKDLTNLENDIKLIERFQRIYVFNVSKLKCQHQKDPCVPKNIC